MELKFVIVSMLFLLWARYLISAANQQTCHVTMICDNGPAWINFTAWNQEQLEKSLHEMYSNIIKEMEADVVTITRRLKRIQKMRADRLISNQTTVGNPSTSNTGITRKQDRTSTTDISPTVAYWGYEDTTNPYTPGLTADYTTMSTMDTFGTEVPSSTTVLSTPMMAGTTENTGANPSSNTVLSTPTMAGTTENPGANPSSTAVFTSSSQTQTTENPGEKVQGGLSSLNVTVEYRVPSCPPYCDSLNEASYITNTWCVVNSQCNCDESMLEIKKHSTKTVHTCMIPVADNCTQICERALADGSKLIPSQHNEFSPDGTFTARIIDGGPKQVQCNCMDGTRTGMLETNGWVIVQRRLDLDANFSRALSDYQRGFTDRSQDFWIGLLPLNEMTRKRSNGAFLQIELGKWENGTMKFYYIRYRRFFVSSSIRNFSLAVEFDSMKNTTYDALDAENEIPIFSVNGSSGWWFTGNSTNLNGKSGILWGNVTYDIAQMLILPQYDEAENCTYANCSRISTTSRTFCIDEYCKCDRSWLLRLMSDNSYRPDWDKTCKVPIGDNCSEICQNLSDMKKLNYPTETVAYKKINGDTYVKVYCKCTEENTGQLVIWRNGNGSFPASLYDNGRIVNDESSGKDERCFYGYCLTSITFCINDKCLCDWSWLAVEQTGTTRGWNICTVPVGDNCVDACRIWSRLKIATSPNRRIAYIKIYGKYEKVYCDCSDNDPGWLVIWEKGDGALLQKSKFEHGFNENGSYWIGFKFIGRLTDQYNASLLMTVRKRSTSEQGKTRLIKYQSFFKNGKNFIGEQPSVVNSSEQETPYLHNFEMDRSSTEWCFEDDTSCAKFGWPISRDLYRYDVMEMKIMTGKVLCPVEYEGKCFLPFTEFTVKCADGTEFCKSIGGHLANIYSQTHMDDVAKFVRSHRMRNNDRMYFQLGMKSENRTIYFHNGTETSMQWLLAGDNNIVAFRVTKELSAGLYIPHNQCKDLYPLCEIEKT